MGKSTVDLQQDGTIPQILAKGSLRLKVMVSSGESNPLKLKKIGSKILGIGWHPPADQLNIKFAVSLLNKNEKSTLVVTDDNFATFNKDLLTPRNLLRIVNGVYDPLGLVSPITIRLRIAFRNVFRSSSSRNWDVPLSGVDQTIWLNLIHMLINSDEIKFARCVKPSHAVGP